MATISNSAFRHLLAVNAKFLERSGARIFHSMQRPWCDAPVARHVMARGFTKGRLETGTPYHLDIWVPCRKCERCLAYKRMDWRARVASEIRLAEKNWFVTLTFRPTARQKLFYEVDDNGVQTLLDASSRNSIAMREVSLFIKRLRAGLGAADSSAARLRFIAVSEPHQDDFPHIHMIIHCGKDYRQKAILDGKWKHGFISAKLCDAHASSYIAKYLTKEFARVRASLNYGLGLPGRKSSLSTKGPEREVANETEKTTEGPQVPDLGQTSLIAGAEVLGTPEAILGAQLYNGEISVDDHASLFATLVSMKEIEHGQLVQATATKTRNARGRTVKSRDECSSGVAGEKSVQDRSANSGKSSKGVSPPDRKAAKPRRAGG